MTSKIKIGQYVVFNEPRKFDTANIKCFTVYDYTVMSIRHLLGGKQFGRSSSLPRSDETVRRGSMRG